MFLRDFRPVSFEANGKPLVVTQEGIQMYNGVQAKDPIYESGTDRVANGHIIVSGDLATQDRMEKYIDVVETDSTSHDSNGINIGTEVSMIMEFSTEQVVVGLSYICDAFNDLNGRFEYSSDGVEWTILLNSLDFPDVIETKSYTFQNDFPAKYYKIVVVNPDTNTASYKGQLANINFVLDDIPTTSAVEGVSGGTGGEGLPADGKLEFEHAELVGVDGSDNKKVSFNILNNSVTATNGIVEADLEVFAFTAERVSSDTIIPANTQFNSYLGVNEAIFAQKHIASNTYLQTGTGVVKFNDIQNDGWRDLLYNGFGINLTGTTDDYNPGGGLYVENTTDTFEAVVTSGNISTIIENEGLKSINITNDTDEKVMNHGLQNVLSSSIYWYSGDLFFKSGDTGANGDKMRLDTNGNLTIKGATKLGETAPNVKEMLYEGTVIVDNHTPDTTGELISLDGMTAVDSSLISTSQIIDYTVMITHEPDHWYKENSLTIDDAYQFITYLDSNRIAIKFGALTKPGDDSGILDADRAFKIYIKYTV